MSTTTSKPLSLTEQIKLAISKKDIKTLYNLKDICDHLFYGDSSYKGYIIKDLPKDNLYEEMVRLIESTADDITATITAEQTSNPDVKHRHQKLISDMWMGSITKETEILEIPDALLLPKFDGCSCGVKLKRYIPGGKFELVEALTRGTTEGYSQNRSNITERFAMLAQPLLSSLNSSTSNSFTLNSKPFSYVLQITLRGEIALKDRTLTDSAPASVVAGKINGGMDVWTNALDTIEFIPYEIMRCNYDLTDYYNYYVPTQTETLSFFSSLHLISFPFITVDLDSSSLPLVQSHFAKLNDSIPQPMDGVVYCSSTWRYPTLNEQTKPKQYGKYAWKPSSEATSTLKSITYSLARDGKFTFILTYDPVRINGKLYKNAKTATSRMVSLDGIGIGSVVTVKLAGDISPMITDFINETDDITPYTLPTKCPFCHKKTLFKKSKGKTPPTLSCVNPTCREVTKQKMKNFLKTLSLKGIAEKTLDSFPTISLESVVEKYVTSKGQGHKSEQQLKQLFANIDTRTFLVAIGIGGAQAVTKKLKTETSLNPLQSLIENYDELCSFLEPYMSSDPFINETVNFLGSFIF